jgi:hypothetical protein
LAASPRTGGRHRRGRHRARANCTARQRPQPPPPPPAARRDVQHGGWRPPQRWRHRSRWARGPAATRRTHASARAPPPRRLRRAASAGATAALSPRPSAAARGRGTGRLQRASVRPQPWIPSIQPNPAQSPPHAAGATAAPDGPCGAPARRGRARAGTLAADLASRWVAGSGGAGGSLAAQARAGSSQRGLGPCAGGPFLVRAGTPPASWPGGFHGTAIPALAACALWSAGRCGPCSPAPPSPSP